MSRPFSVCVALILVVSGRTARAQEPPAPPPAVRPSPSPSIGPAHRLRLDIERHVDSIIRDHRGTPNFETSLEVVARAPDLALAEQLAGFDLECGPTMGPPSTAETREFRPHPAPYLDLAALARQLSGAVGNPGPPRYFLYRVRTPDGVDYLLREERLTVAQQVAGAAGTFELMAGFPDLTTALRAWRRLARGFADPLNLDSADPPPPWATTPCRLRARR